MAKLVVALFGKPSQAQNVVRALIDNGFRRENISLVVNQSIEPTEAAPDAGLEFLTGSQALKAPGVDGLVGAVASLVVGLSVINVPGQGSILAAGPISAELMSVSGSQPARSLTAALSELGVPSNQADLFAMGIWQGGSLVALHSDDDSADEAASIIDLYYPFDIDQLARHWQTAKHSTPPDETEMYTRTWRQHYQAAFSPTKTPFIEYEPAYRYGYQLGSDPACLGQGWDDLEEHARQDWELDHPSQKWDQVREAVRLGWSLVVDAH